MSTPAPTTTGPKQVVADTPTGDLKKDDQTNLTQPGTQTTTTTTTTSPSHLQQQKRKSSSRTQPPVLPVPPGLTTSFKSVLPPIHRDYRNIQFSELDHCYLYMPSVSFLIRSFTHPFQVIKTRMQTTVSHRQPNPRTPFSSSPYHAAPNTATTASATPKPRIIPYNPLPIDFSKRTMLNSLALIAEKEGIRSLYAGYGIAVLSLFVGPLYMTTLETVRSNLNQTNTLPSSVVPFVAGGFASCVAQVFSVPLDVIQNCQMKEDRLRRQSALTLVKDVFQTQGVRGFYKGFSITLIANAPMSAFVWSTFAQIHPFLSTRIPPSISRLMTPALTAAPPSATPSASTSTSNTSPTVTTGSGPLTNLPTLTSPTKSPSLTPTSSVTSVTVTTIPQTSIPSSGQYKWNYAELLVVAVSAALSGAVAAMITLPLDVLKTRLQTSGSDATFRSTWSQLRKERGYGGFVAGWRPRLFHATTTPALLMTTYEILKRICLREENERPQHQHQAP